MVKTKGFDSAYDFVVDVIAQTQGVYTRPIVAIGRTSQLGRTIISV